MSDVQYRMLSASVVLCCLFAGCASGGRQSDSMRVDSDYYSTNNIDLYIDNQRGVAQTSAWRADLEDCSTEEYNCIRIRDQFDLAFPVRCTTSRILPQFISPVGLFRLFAPALHLSPPSGGYVSVSNPNIAIMYARGVGIFEVRITNEPAFSSAFNINSTIVRYNIIGMDEIGIFDCDY